MRLLIFALALLLSGCWVGDGLYSSSDASQAIPAGIYSAINSDGETRLERVTILPNGLTQIGVGDETGFYGFAPLDRDNRRFVAWYHKDDGSSDDRTQLYLLLERRSADEFLLDIPQCKGELADIARRAGAKIEQGTADACEFATRASLEAAMRQIQISKDAVRIVRLRGK